MLKALEVNRYKFTSNDQLFLDANIWLYLYGPQNPKASRNVKTYSQVFSRILNAGSRIYVDVLIISEFINSYARQQWKLIASDMEFKAFRNSLDFEPVAQGIAGSVKRVINHCSRLESGFGALKMDTLLDAYSAGNSDFNDQVITELCKVKGLTLITHDGDFKGQGISILTANRHLLN